MSSLSDLSDYYTIKKLSTGWLVGSKQNNEARFIPNDELVRMGYIRKEDHPKPPDISHSPTVIVVPTGEKRRFDLSWRRAD